MRREYHALSMKHTGMSRSNCNLAT